MRCSQWKKEAFKQLRNNPYYAEDEAWWLLRLPEELLAHQLASAGSAGEKILREDGELGSADLAALDAMLARLLAGEPLPLITGLTWFYGWPIRCYPGVLIPRPDSELIVHEVLKCLLNLSESRTELYLWDLCTGSGCLAAACAKSFAEERPAAILHVTATDISSAALQAAKRNFRHLGLEETVQAVQADLWPPRSPGSEAATAARCDVVMANPPYLTEAEWEASELGLYEPETALAAGPDGLQLIRRLLDEGRYVLSPGAFLYIEHGFAQAEALQQLGSTYPEWKYLGFCRDLAGRPRVTVWQLE